MLVLGSEYNIQAKPFIPKLNFPIPQNIVAFDFPSQKNAFKSMAPSQVLIQFCFPCIFFFKCLFYNII